jgi:hypothetical protein
VSDYSLLSRLLHELALGRDAIAEASFAIERATAGRSSPGGARGDPVFVSGLARSGSTALLRGLFEGGEFCSLTYRDMPFVLAPGLWSRVTARSRTDRAATERAHGDGIMVDFDSPEALDEVFWRVFEGERYIRADRLVPVEASEETVESFRTYVALIQRRYGGRRYLSKNNNNILRIPSLIRAFPECRILCPYRDPAQQAYSLLRQHQLFCERHRADAFSRRYMRWLVHCEFGADHRPFAWGAETDLDPMSLDYWIVQWTAIYAHLVGVVRGYPRNVLPVSYERLCADADKTLGTLGLFLGTSKPIPARFAASIADLPVRPTEALLDRAWEVYRALDDQAAAREGRLSSGARGG